MGSAGVAEQPKSAVASLPLASLRPQGRLCRAWLVVPAASLEFVAPAAPLPPWLFATFGELSRMVWGRLEQRKGRVGKRPGRQG